jgi:Xaa-Pro aminopeptidase
MGRMSDFLTGRRERAATAWGLTREIVLVGAGEPIGVPGGADMTYPFVAHSEYFWLTDRDAPGGVLAFDPQAGWTDFVPAVSEAERVWEGRTDSPGTPLPELTGWLAARRGRAIVQLGVPLPGVAGDTARARELGEALTHARRPKDSIELERMRHAAAATAAGFAAAVASLRPGVTERALQIELETGFQRAGADGTGYGTIVGAGPHSGILHFLPSARTIAEGDALLIDAGAQVRRYVADVTRTYRAGARDAGFFRDLYTVVLGVEERAITRCVRGAEWRDVHLAAALEIAEGLARLGILKGAADQLVERDAHALFFPHGLGHLVGLGVRDASGYLPGRPRSTRPGLSMLRTDLPLEPGYTITVEPGVYFIPALLQDPDRRATYRDVVDWTRVDRLMEFGGIRIEDNVHVTSGAPENLTHAVPKRIEDALIG